MVKAPYLLLAALMILAGCASKGDVVKSSNAETLFNDGVKAYQTVLFD
ncbi:MAG: hypothetical protein IME98_01805, partial [Proteobacteria bacterium]|nr:hypothetical protein [Pseudomonadota bacterium]